MYGRRPRHDSQNLAEELRRFRAPPEVIAAALREREDEVVAIHPDNVETVTLFAALSTQWRHAGLTGVRIGLDYQAIEPTARMLGITLNPNIFSGLRVMEMEALAAMREESY